MTREFRLLFTASQQVKLILRQIQRGLAGLMGIGHQGGQDIDHGVDDTAMAGVLDLLDVFELVVDGFDDRTLTQQQLIHHGHQFVVHVLADFGNQLQAPLPEFVEQFLGNIAAIADQLPAQSRRQFGYRFPVIDVAGGDAKGQEFAAIVHYQMELEAIEPTHGGFAAAGDLLEDLVTMDATVVADHQRGGIDEGDPGILTAVGVEINTHRHQGRGDQCDKSIVTQQVGKLTPAMPAHLQ